MLNPPQDLAEVYNELSLINKIYLIKVLSQRKEFQKKGFGAV